MIRFREHSAIHGRAEALDRHVDWLLSRPIADGTDIPFYREAKAFCESYLQHKLLYFESLKKQGKETEVHRK